MLFVGLILAFVFLMAILHWWSEGMIEASDAVILATILCWASLGMSRAHTIWQWAVVLFPLIGVGAYVAYSFKIGGLRSFYRRQCEEYTHAIQVDPNNVAARQYLANTLYKLDELDRAIDEMRVALEMASDIECEHKLAAWSRERYFRDTQNPYCRMCLVAYPLGSRICKKCGSRLSYQSLFSRWLSGGSIPGIRYYTLILFGMALMILSITFLPWKYALIPLGLVVLAVTGWAFIGSARS